jgi:hypothetical protein
MASAYYAAKFEYVLEMYRAVSMEVIQAYQDRPTMAQAKHGYFGKMVGSAVHEAFLANYRKGQPMTFLLHQTIPGSYSLHRIETYSCGIIAYNFVTFTLKDAVLFCNADNWKSEPHPAPIAEGEDLLALCRRFYLYPSAEPCRFIIPSAFRHESLQDLARATIPPAPCPSPGRDK